MSSRVTKNEHVIDLDTRSLISVRYKRITKAVNQTFWNSISDTAHSFYVGSYGRGTAINTSDLDVLIELPDAEYNHFSNIYGNGPSRLLQSVKNAILDTYPRTDIRGWDGTYKYPDSHMGGNWMSTNPKAEQDAIKEKNEQSNGLLYDACKHIRYIRDNNFQSYHLSGILIDSFMHNAIKGWHFLRDGEQPSGCRETFEEAMLKYYNEISLNGYITPQIQAPGSNMKVDASKGWDVLGKVLRYMV